MKTKVVSQLDEDGYFVCPAIADESPLEEGVWLLPGGSVDAPPPTIPNKKRAKWGGEKFVIEAVVIVQPAVIEPIPKTPEVIQKEMTAAIQTFMDHQALAHGYDDIKSAALRAGYPGPFHDEGVKFAQWMDSCWSYGYAVIANVKVKSRPMPTAEEIISELPPLVL